jgi:hypothetical protein
MKTKSFFVGLSSLALVFSTAATFVACSSDDNANPSPTPLDASGGNDTGVDSGPRADTGGGDSSSDAPNDAPDAAPCASDAATCNSCVTPQQDPLHACSPATANCIPFDNTRVPANVPSP